MLNYHLFKEKYKCLTLEFDRLFRVPLKITAELRKSFPEKQGHICFCLFEDLQ